VVARFARDPPIVARVAMSTIARAPSILTQGVAWVVARFTRAPWVVGRFTRAFP
jgi:hypothetical protein